MNNVRYFWSGPQGHFYTDRLDAGEKIVKHLPEGEDYTATDLQPDAPKDVELTPFPPYGDLMTAEEFITEVKRGSFIPYDGDRYWATATGESRLNVWETLQNSRDMKVWETKKPEWATHVMWYNR